MTTHSIHPQPVRQNRQPRESTSLFWPILFIGAGVLLMLSNAGQLSGDLFAILLHYWPLIFVVIGLDILFSRSGWIGTLISGLTGLAVVAGITYLLMTPGAGVSLSERLNLRGFTQLTTDRLVHPLNATRSARLELALAGGTSSIASLVDSDKLFEGSYVHRGDAATEVTGAGSAVNVRISRPPGVQLGPINLSGERLDLKLNTAVTYDLSLSAASGRHVVDASDLDISALSLKMASGTVDLKLPEALPYSVALEMASGTVYLDLPKNTPVRMNVKGLSGNVQGDAIRRVDGNRLNGTYETPGLDATRALVEIDVNMLSGNLVVR